jgi:hypothetical protein
MLVIITKFYKLKIEPALLVQKRSHVIPPIMTIDREDSIDYCWWDWVGLFDRC